jgi:hypothetical protein
MASFRDLWLVMVFFTLSYAFPWLGVFLLLPVVGYFLVSRPGLRALPPQPGLPGEAIGQRNPVAHRSPGR